MNMKKLNILLSSAKTGFALRLQNTNFWCFHKLAANDCNQDISMSASTSVLDIKI